MSTPIHLDLRRDLSKVREQYDEIVGHLGSCSYASPCVVGAMLPPEVRRPLDMGAEVGIAALLRKGVVTAPREQWADIHNLQAAFDDCSREFFDETLARLEAKYAAQVTA